MTALVAALNDRAKLPDLDRFPAWRDQPPVPSTCLTGFAVIIARKRNRS